MDLVKDSKRQYLETLECLSAFMLKFSKKVNVNDTIRLLSKVTEIFYWIPAMAYAFKWKSNIHC